MAITKRRQQNIEDMKASILEAANELFIKEGYEHTTLRKIAKKIDYNQATIYNYYSNKEEIFYELQRRAFVNFYEEFNELRESKIKGYEKFKWMGRKYINYALKHPEEYKLMFILKKPMEAAERLDPEWKIGAKNYELLKEVIRECIDEGSLQLDHVESGAYMVWSFVHGLVSLVIMDRCQMIPEVDIDFLVKQAHMTFENLIKK